MCLMRACGVRGSSGLYEKSAEAWDRVVLPRNRVWALENWRLALGEDEIEVA